VSRYALTSTFCLLSLFIVYVLAMLWLCFICPEHMCGKAYMYAVYVYFLLIGFRKYAQRRLDSNIIYGL
jgi:hypothetical protein